MSKITDFLKLIRITNLLMIALSLSLFYYLLIVPVHHNILVTDSVPFDIPHFILFVLSVLLVAAAGNIINDYFDFELDKQYKPERPLAKGSFSLDTAMYLHMFFAISGIALGFYLSWKAGYTKIGYLYVVCALALYLYSAYLKKLPLIGNVVIAGLTGFVFVVLMLFEGRFLLSHSYTDSGYAFRILGWQAWFFGGFAFLMNFVREVVKDIEDREGDADFKIYTVAVQFGEAGARWIALFVLLLVLGVLGFFMKGFFEAGAKMDFYYLLLLVLLPLLYTLYALAMAKTAAQYARVSLMLKFIMLLGLLAIPAFYLFHNYMS